MQFFSVISQNIIESHVPLRVKTLTNIAIHNIYLTQQVIYTFGIILQKYKRIVLWVKVDNKVSFILFSGPGYLSLKQTILKSG